LFGRISQGLRHREVSAFLSALRLLSGLSLHESGEPTVPLREPQHLMPALFGTRAFLALTFEVASTWSHY
jgi:hypothetical protein